MKLKNLRKKVNTNIPIWTKPFLTFSKTRDIAKSCLCDYNQREQEEVDKGLEEEDEGADDYKTKLDDDCVKVLFTVKNPKGAFASNMMTGNFKRFKKWDEIVILPFTGFYVKNVKKITDDPSLNNALELELEYYDLKEPEIDYGIVKVEYTIEKECLGNAKQR